MKRMWDRATIVGCGLIGASFALALKRARACERIAGWDTSVLTLDAALARGVIDEVDSSFAGGAVSSSALIYLAMPVKGIIEFLGARGRQIKPGAVVTDAGSTKSAVCRAARAHLPADRQFIGGHPIAGSHLRGLEHASADLFVGAAYVLVAGEDERETTALVALRETLERLGARVFLMTADEHDRALALVSHLPQLASSALAAVVKDQPDARALAGWSGAGYRDMTRLAASSWSVWRDILATNPAHIGAALDLLIRRLTIVRDELQSSSERSVFEATSRLFVEDEQE
jgi:prephenate dehydrogenase